MLDKLRIMKPEKMKSLLFRFFVYAVVISVLSYLHLLQLKYVVILVILLIVTIPFELYSKSVRAREKKHFDEMCLYMKHVVINYKISHKIFQSLKDTLNVFDEKSNMYKCIESAIVKLINAQSFDEALAEIEKDYCNSYMKQIHQFMILGEESVGEVIDISLSQVNVKEWQLDVEMFETNKLKIKQYNVYFALGSVLASYGVLFILNDYANLLRVNAKYQLITFGYFVFFILAYIVITMLLTSKWVKENE